MTFSFFLSGYLNYLNSGYHNLIYAILYLTVSGIQVTECPYCHNEASKPDKVLDNCAFHIEAFTCKNCQRSFKVSCENHNYFLLKSENK